MLAIQKKTNTITHLHRLFFSSWSDAAILKKKHAVYRGLLNSRLDGATSR